MLDGSALPSWLSYSPETNSFTVSNAPLGSFSIEIIVTVNGQATTVVISKSADMNQPQASVSANSMSC